MLLCCPSQVVDHVADFALSCGLVRYNPFALPLLTFIRKCTGVSAQELHGMATNAGITPVLYPPRAAGRAITCASQEAATIAAALAAAGGGASDAGADSCAGATSPFLVNPASMGSRSGTPGEGTAGAAAGQGNSSGADAAAGAAATGSPRSGSPAVEDGTHSETAPAADADAISAAAEAAQQQIAEAIASARQTASGRAGTASSTSSLRAKRVPGVAGSSGGAAPRRPGSAVSFAEPAAASGAAQQGGMVSDSDDEPLPDLGGQPAVGRAKADLAAAAAEWRASDVAA